jgi:uncharacterized protein (DUF362 family)
MLALKRQYKFIRDDDMHRIEFVNRKPKIRTFFENKSRVVKITAPKKIELNQNQIDKMVKIAIDNLGGIQKFVKKKDTVLIKPNMACCYPKEIRGLTTDVRVVESIIKLLKKEKIKNIIIGEGTGINLPNCSEYIFIQTGLKDLAKKWNVPLIDFKKDDYVEFKMVENQFLKNIRIAKTAYFADVLINVAVMKGYPFSQCCKNLHGIIPDKDKPLMHQNIKFKSLELAKTIRPTLCIVDGIYGAKFHGGNAVRYLESIKFNIILASADPLAIDTIGAKLWGYKLDETDLLDLNYGEKIGVGNYKNLDLIEVMAK